MDRALTALRHNRGTAQPLFGIKQIASSNRCLHTCCIYLANDFGEKQPELHWCSQEVAAALTEFQVPFMNEYNIFQGANGHKGYDAEAKLQAQPGKLPTYAILCMQCISVGTIGAFQIIQVSNQNKKHMLCIGYVTPGTK